MLLFALRSIQCVRSIETRMSPKDPRIPYIGLTSLFFFFFFFGTHLAVLGLMTHRKFIHILTPRHPVPACPSSPRFGRLYVSRCHSKFTHRQSAAVTNAFFATICAANMIYLIGCAPSCFVKCGCRRGRTDCHQLSPFSSPDHIHRRPGSL